MRHGRSLRKTVRFSSSSGNNEGVKAADADAAAMQRASRRWAAEESKLTTASEPVRFRVGNGLLVSNNQERVVLHEAGGKTAAAGAAPAVVAAGGVTAGAGVTKAPKTSFNLSVDDLWLLDEEENILLLYDVDSQSAAAAAVEAAAPSKDPTGAALDEKNTPAVPSSSVMRNKSASSSDSPERDCEGGIRGGAPSHQHERLAEMIEITRPGHETRPQNDDDRHYRKSSSSSSGDGRAPSAIMPVQADTPPPPPYVLPPASPEKLAPRRPTRPASPVVLDSAVANHVGATVSVDERTPSPTCSPLSRTSAVRWAHDDMRLDTSPAAIRPSLDIEEPRKEGTAARGDGRPRRGLGTLRSPVRSRLVV